MALADPAILQTLMQWRTRISAAAWLVLRDVHAAEDIFQNVALKSMTQGLQFENEASLVSWALVSARREAIDWNRRRQAEARFLDAKIAERIRLEWESDAEWMSYKSEALQACLEQAPEGSRHLLRLRYFEGQKCEQVAEKLGVGLQVVYKRLSRLHQSLRACVESKLRLIGENGGAFK